MQGTGRRMTKAADTTRMGKLRQLKGFSGAHVSIAMIMGVSAAPRPALSTLMLCVGILMKVHVHRDIQISMRGGIDF